jgi:aspartyl-tRNA(Asn)/glutamyl-tRNA(Gln) amidotransferase subunit A
VSEEVCYLSANELIERFRRRELSPVEVTEAILRRIERYDPALNAFVTVTADLAIDQAIAAEHAYLSGEAGPLAGVPISIKDLTPTRGIRTTMGSLTNPDWVPDFDPPFIERVYAAGAVMLGKNATPEYGWKGETSSPLSGSTHNPWRNGLTPGGSSGGSAAAVAAGFGPLSQGSDGAGSIRIPSSFSGIFGLKPSYGLVALYPPSAVGELAHIGPMTRTVRDSALLMNVVAGADARDRHSWSSGIDYVAATDSASVEGLRIAWSSDLGYAAVESEVVAIAKRAAYAFEGLGAIVIDAHPPLSDPWEVVDILWSTSMAALATDRLTDKIDLLDPALQQVIERGQSFSAEDVKLAMRQQNAYYEGMRHFMESYDLFLTPTLPCTAFPVGQANPDAIDGKPTSYLGWTAFTYPANVTGLPAASVPAGFDATGLPVGLQIVGRWHDDASVLAAAAVFERYRPWSSHRPDLDALLEARSSDLADPV